MVRIWVVDDHPRSMEFLTSAFPLGYQKVTHCTLIPSFEEWESILPLTAPELFPHILFLDYYLPHGHTGEEVYFTLQHFLTTHPDHTAPLLIGYSSTHSKNLRFQELGLLHTLQKFTPEGISALHALFPTLASLTQYNS